MAITTYGDISQRTAAAVMVPMLEVAESVQVIPKFLDVKPLPKNKANNVKFRRPNPYPKAVTPLTEGATPAARKMSYTDVSCQLEQIGDLASLTDVVADTAEDPVLQDMTRLAAIQAAETKELRAWGVLRGGTSVFYANGSSRAGVNTSVSKNLMRKAVRFLKAQKARKITEILSPSVNIGTKPVEAAYVALCHTDLEADIREMPGFIPVAEYGSRNPLCPSEFGSLEDVRFITSEALEPFADAGGNASGKVLSTGGSKADVYPILLIGQHCAGTVALKGYGSIKPIVINPNTPSKSDALGQRGYVGWKTWDATVILNENWMTRIEVAAQSL